ncbi:hypothetical protein PAESOLCIP111_05629 [Paenibacillus solanacearum]|uniref:F5/8 type C domain-containing protein n=1 Tax=Paenibacillus solanacearum TaxID=2048548 RepID=A0A916NYP9_9BACL|nr:discoidin domain-containing protein [Paenibacillus solanacearum]CAG7648573.1 hypothetical protein PAESOLCIP111_05629 [Paenibacillus solanacearum]
MISWKKSISRWMACFLLLSVLLPALPGGVLPSHAANELANLALNQKVTKSSDCSCGRATEAVDGDQATFWQPLAADRADGTVWIAVDLGASYDVDEVKLDFRTGSVSSYAIQTSTDQSDWHDAIVKNVTGSISGKVVTVNFPAVNTRYARLLVTLSNTNFQLNEIGIYSTNWTPPPAVIDSVYIMNGQGQKLGEYDTTTLSRGASHAFTIGGTMTDGTTADLSAATVSWTSAKADVATVDASGNVIAVNEGAVKITGQATLSNLSKEASVWVDVYDPGTLLVDVGLDHPSMVREIGQPALLNIGDAYPSVRLLPYAGGTALASLVSTPDGQVIQSLPAAALSAGTGKTLSFSGTVPKFGSYEIRLQFQFPGKKPVYDTLYFTAQNPTDVGPDESSIAYTGADGKMMYVPDYRGNRIIDFSNVGYMGGGVKLPDVQARIALEPVAGDADDTARIQAAIDQVSQMPQSAEGFRGAVLLKKGTYRVGGTLYIRASGVVLRGEGQGEDGTILYATGTAKRNILEIQGKAPKLLTDHATKISDLFVPSGAKSFNVEDAAKFKVGDKVKVRRYGNSRWIHEIHMDTIFERDGTVQWTPFNLDFDRVITAVDLTRNRIAIDAPLANSIERRWGGGEVIQYEDPDRIEQIGVENLRVDSAFDPSVTATQSGKTYYSDENHAVSFAIFTNVKNAWMREVTGLHLNHALAHVSRGSKWVTVQDNKSLDMVSVITGGNRYPYKMSGELTLMQRNYAETARHAFVVDSRVQGPNVFLDSQSVNEYATSEPHHRWSVGGLYDNISAEIAIQDRGLLGSGHGWSGANYVTWNTEGGLVSQQPITAQNYAIGHVGAKKKPYLPNADDKRPRNDAYWEHLGSHVSPRSLYLQQLQDRLGTQAVQNIAQTPLGGGAWNVPQLPQNLPLLKGIKINNKQLDGFTPEVFDYTVQLPAGSTSVPSIRPHDMRHDAEIIDASTVYGTSVLIIREKKHPAHSVRYNVRFTVPASSGGAGEPNEPNEPADPGE